MVDTWFGYFRRQVENMGLLENTAVIFTTDHGFYFGEHGGLFGKLTRAKPSINPYYFVRDNLWTYSPLYEELINIPLMIYIPQVASGTYNGLNSAIDLMPTVLDIMNVNIPEQVKGKSLLPMLKDTSKKGREYVISTIPFRNPSEKVRLVDGSFHDVDSSEMAFKVAGSMALQDGCKKADPVLLEPVMSVEVVVPEEYLGDVIGDLNS